MCNQLDLISLTYHDISIPRVPAHSKRKRFAAEAFGKVDMAPGQGKMADHLSQRDHDTPAHDAHLVRRGCQVLWFTVRDDWSAYRQEAKHQSYRSAISKTCRLQICSASISLALVFQSRKRTVLRKMPTPMTPAREIITT